MIKLACMKREQIVSYFFIGLFLFILYQLLLIFSPFFAAISWAAILAFGFYPVYQRFKKLRRMNSVGAALLATMLVILIVVIPAAFAVVSLMKEAIELYYKVSEYISGGNLDIFIQKVRQAATSNWAEQLWLLWNPTYQKDVSDLILQGAKGIGNFAALQLATLTKNLFSWVLNLILIAFLLFFFFRDGEAMYEFVYRLIPMAKKNKDTLSERINETFSAVIRGQFVTCIVQGAIAGFTFWILGLPLPFFFGFLTFLTSMIPLTGAATVWVPFAVYLFLTHQTGKGIA